MHVTDKCLYHHLENVRLNDLPNKYEFKRKILVTFLNGAPASHFINAGIQ